jgi:hypothetical protein
MRLRYPAGTILLVRRVTDLQGGNPKDRNVVLVEAMDADTDDEETQLLGLGITSKFDDPISPPCVELEFGRHGRCLTGLVTRSVAHCEWYVLKPTSDIIKRQGHVGNDALREIMRILAARFRKGE